MTSNYGAISGSWIVCQSDTSTAWIAAAASSGGTFQADLICNYLGFSSVTAYGGTCGTVCGYCSNGGAGCGTTSTAGHVFDGAGEGVSSLSSTVHWVCGDPIPVMPCLNLTIASSSDPFDDPSTIPTTVPTLTATMRPSSVVDAIINNSISYDNDDNKHVYQEDKRQLHHISTLATSQNFPYTGFAQYFIVPASVTQLTVTLTGASGSNSGIGGYAYVSYNGGYGSIITCTIPVTPNMQYQINVGGVGSSAGIGGWNGGGPGGSSPESGGGGGSTDIRSGMYSLSERLAVAGGGGGANGYGQAVGGNGGYPIGGTGQYSLKDGSGGEAYPDQYPAGGGGTQLTGGTGSSVGSLFYGGDGSSIGNSLVGGGGGGYYGGGASLYGSGGGGSSYTVHLLL